MALPPVAFAEQVQWLAANAAVVPLEALLDSPPRRGLSAAITFDDGYRSVHDLAAPILADAGFTGCVYVNTALIAEREHRKSDVSEGHYPGDEFLCWDDVARLRAAGWIIGSHGTEHLDLTRQAGEVIRGNIEQSKSVIEQRIGTRCRHFAYTWGRHNRLIRDAVTRAGYESAVAGIHGAVQSGSDRFALPRLDVRRDYQLADFAALMRGAWDFLRYPQMARRIFE